MGKTRLEAFSDGVIAIIITIMVLELKAPHGAGLSDLFELYPVFLSYVLSFIYVGIYWNNHHHLLHTVRHLSAGIMWSNLHLLFWLSLLPFSTAWMDENHFSQWPVFLYCFNLLAAAIAYFILQRAIIREHGRESELKQAIGSDLKGKLSPVAYLIAMALTFVAPILSVAICVGVALVWLIPDRRIERLAGK